MLRIEDYKLPNGLRVVLNEDHSAPLVAVNLWYHVGSKNERRGRTGFAHLFEHMLFSGSEHVGNNEHFRYVQSIGGVLNGTTFFDRTNYFETLPSNYLALGLWLESDRMGFFLPAERRLGVRCSSGWSCLVTAGQNGLRHSRVARAHDVFPTIIACSCQGAARGPLPLFRRGQFDQRAGQSADHIRFRALRG